jgi:HAD superfamily hydrolase (TIGR01549 family)
MKAYTTYIFDLDGTLTDTMAVWLGIFRDGLIHFGMTPPDDKTLSQYTHNWNELTKIGFPEDKLDDFAQFAYKAANQRLPEAAMHVGALEMLETLQSHGKRIAIFSTMDRQIFEPAMHHRDLGKFAEVSVAGTDVPLRKPHPDGIVKALHDLGITPDDYNTAVYIGDKDTDIQAAHNAGIDGILYYPAAHQIMYDLDELKKYDPAAIVTDWNELVSTL